MALLNFVGYLMPKIILADEQQWYYLTYILRDEGFMPFPKGISLKVNLTAQ